MSAKIKKITDKWTKIKIVLTFLAVFLCTVIGGYGILRAPKSDQTEMEQELKQHQQELEQADADSDMKNHTKEESVASPAASTQNPCETEHPSEQDNSDESLSVIGDSVFLGAAPSFKKLYKHTVIDAKVSRQVSQALGVAKKMKQKKKLGNIVIISLGTNGNFNQATGQALIDYLGTERTIFWIDAYGKKLDIQKQVNRTIQKLVNKNNNVHLISWSQEAKKHPGWFYQDGTHLNLKGQDGFSRFIMKSIRQYSEY